MTAGPREHALVAAVLRAVGVYAGKPADRPAIVRMLIAPGAPLAKFSAEDLAAPAVDPRTLIA